jgi:KDEL-tailed cysteine endopeptidase
MQGECIVKSSNRKIYIAGYKELPCNADAETTLKNAVMHQPVIATIFVGEEFDHYRAGDGIFQTEASSGENHAVLVIGFGERDGRKYWLIRNSYGTQWGYKGYGLIERGVEFFGRCGIAFILRDVVDNPHTKKLLFFVYSPMLYLANLSHTPENPRDNLLTPGY